jgi:hypothetical protein
MPDAPPWPTWIERWERAIDAARALGATTYRLSIDRPATRDEVAAVEESLGSPIPLQFRRTLLEFSRRVEFFWFLPDGVTPPQGLTGVFYGSANWDVENLVQPYQEVSWLATNAFMEGTPEHELWKDKFPFHLIACGNFIAIDTSSPQQQVVFLNHELDDDHGYRLGADFFDFMDRWTQLGCPDEVWQPFVPDPLRFIDLSADGAKAWQRWFGLPPSVA